MTLYCILSVVFSLCRDVNDNNPFFIPEADALVNVAENATAGTLVEQLVSDDRDSDNITKLSYRLLPNDEGLLTYGLFSLDTESGAIRLTGKLDREARQNYTLRVEVSDGSGLTATKDVNIQVTDINDNVPVFTEQVYSGSVSEDIMAGTSFLRVNATDADVSRFNIRYYISSGNNGNVFTINDTTGVLSRSSSGSLNYETGPRKYDLIVAAEDSAEYSGSGDIARLTGRAQVVINILDANDNAPMFAARQYVVSIPEHSTGDVSVLTVAADDLDSGTNAELVFSITGGGGANNFTINNKTGLIESPPVLDYETAHQLNISLMVEDMGLPVMFGTASVVVNILDINDNAPQFVNTPYTTTVSEDENGTLVYDLVSATDEDSASNQDLTYSIFSGNDAGHFLINPSTGAIYLNGSQLDILRQRVYSLVIEVRDAGVPRLSAFTTIVITALDANNHQPVFSQNVYTANISELSAAGTSVLTILATDNDEDASGNVTYRLSGLNAAFFNIDTFNGLVTLSNFGANNIDFDGPPDGRLYSFVVEAEDLGPSPTAVKASIIVFLVNENDNTPVFMPDEDTEVTIPEKLSVGSNITQVFATDADPGDDATLRYAIVGGNDGRRFELNPATGELTLVGSLNFESTSFYNLSVSVSDGGTPVLSMQTNILITVADSNDHTPIFIGVPYTQRISEDTAIGTALFDVNATDVDTQSDYGTIRYSFDNRTEASYGATFTVDPISGVVTLASMLDRENISSYLLTVVASDNQFGSGNPQDRTQLSTTTSLMFTITDVNDRPPVFSGIYPNVTISEHDQFSVFVTEVVATDADLGMNGAVTFSLKGANGKFTVQTFTRGTGVYVGRILTQPPIDFENNTLYVLEVIASDGGSPALAASTFIYVSVQDSNDNAPLFNQSTYTTDVYENTPNYTYVIRMFAEDTDSGLAGMVRYSIAGDDGKFTIGNVDGIIRTTADPLDRELKSLYELQVTASDLSNQSFASTAEVVVTVLDRNDEIPVFSSLKYSVEVPETLEAGMSVLQLTASDRDIMENGNFTFSLISSSGGGWFVIDPDTGLVSVSDQRPVSPFPLPLCINDTRATKKFEVIVFVQDTGSPPQISNATLEVTIRDVNSFTPEFEQPSYISRLDKSAPSGTVVLPRLVATDRDGCGGNLTYTLLVGDTTLFAVDPVTGETVLSRDLPTNDTYFLTVGATDSLSPFAKLRTGTVRLTVLVGHLLPVSFTVDGPQTFAVPELGRSSSLEYVNDVWMYDGGSSSQAASSRYSLAGYTDTSSATSTAQQATIVGANLSERDVWPENPNVVGSVHVRGSGHRSNNLQSAAVDIIVTPLFGSLSPVTVTCTPNSVSGLCFGAVPLPTSWFTSSMSEPLTRNATVSYKFTSSPLPATFFDTIRIHRNPNRCTSNLGVLAEFPSGYFLPSGSRAEVKFYAHARFPVSTFTITVSLSPGLSYVTENSPRHTVTAKTEGNTVVFIGLIDDQNTVAQPVTNQESLFSMFLQVNLGASQPVDGYLPVSYSVNFLTNVNKERISNPSLLYASRNEDGQCNDTAGRIYIEQNDLLYMLAYVNDSVILNSAVWDDVRVASSISVMGMYRSGVPSTESAGLTCISSDTSVLQLEGCSLAFVNGTETRGASTVTVGITKGNITTSVPLRVWYPDQITIYVEDRILNAISGLYASPPACSTPVYQRSAVRVECSVGYDGGSVRQQIIITRNVRSTIRSSASSIVQLVWNGDALTANGVSVGTTKLEIVAGGRMVTSVDVSVTPAAVNITDIHFELVSGVNTSQLAGGTVGNQHYQSSRLTVQREVGYENAVATVVSSALFSDGRQMQLSTSNGLRLSSLNSSVLTVTGERVTVLQSGRGLLLSGSWAACDGGVLRNASGLFDFNLETPESIKVSVGRQDLTTRGDASAQLSSHTDSTSVRVEYVYRSGTLVVDVTNDPRLHLNISGNSVLSWSQTTPGTIFGGVQRGVATITAYLTHRPSIVSPPLSITVISSTGIRVSLRVQSNTRISTASTIQLRQYADVQPVAFQQGQISSLLELSNGQTEDISSQASYTVPPALATVAGRVLSPTGSTGQFRLAATFGSETGMLIVTVDGFARLTSILRLASSSGNTLSGVRNQATATLVVDGNFDDGTTYPSIVQNGIVLLPGLLEFSSNDTSTVSVNNITGQLRLHSNSPVPVEISVTSPNTVSTTANLFANLQPASTDMDIGATTGAPIPPVRRSRSFSVPVRLNVDGFTVGAIKLEVRYNPNAFSIGDVQPGANWPGGIFEKTTNDPPGVVSFGGSISSPHTGTSNMEIAVITFTAEMNGRFTFNSSVVQLTRQGAAGTDIGAPGPRDSIAGQVSTWVYGSGSRRRRSAEFVNSYYPREEVHSRSRRAAGDVLGDANADGQFDLRDVQFLQTFLLERELVNQGIVPIYPSSAFRNLSSSQLAAMDPDLSGDRNPEDSVYLVRVNFKLQRFINNIEVLPSQGVGSNCSLAINISVFDLLGQMANSRDTAVLVGLTNSQPSFGSSFTGTQLFSGTLLNQTFTTQNSQYGGYWQASDFGNGVFGIRTVPSAIAQEGIGLTFVIVTFDGLGKTETSRQAVVGGTISPPFAFGPLDVNVSLATHGNTPVRVFSTNGYNPVQFINNTIAASVCFNFHTPVFVFANGDLVSQTSPYSYFATDREDVPLGDIITTVTAVDGDTSLPSGQVKFDIVHQSTPGIFNLTTTSSHTGQLILIRPLDYEARVVKDEYVVDITVTDQGRCWLIACFAQVVTWCSIVYSISGEAIDCWVGHGLVFNCKFIYIHPVYMYIRVIYTAFWYLNLFA